MGGARARVQTLANLRGSAGYTWNTNLVTWTSMPSATTELLGNASRRLVVDLSNRTQIRLAALVAVVGATGAKLGIQWSVDIGTNWFFFNADADGDLGSHAPQVSIDTLGIKLSAYLAIPVAAMRQNVLVRVVGDDGNGSTSPAFGLSSVEVS